MHKWATLHLIQRIPTTISLNMGFTYRRMTPYFCQGLLIYPVIFEPTTVGPFTPAKILRLSLGWVWDTAFTFGHPRTHVSCASLCSSVRLGMGCCCIYPWPSRDTCKLCFTLLQSLAGQGMLLHLPVATQGHK